MTLLRQADPAAYQRARELLGSKRAPRGHGQPMVLGAVLDLADERLCVAGYPELKELRRAVVLPMGHIQGALRKLCRGGWLERSEGGYKLLPKSFGEPGAAT